MKVWGLLSSIWVAMDTSNEATISTNLLLVPAEMTLLQAWT
jgi:hypothetical protein